MANHNLAIGEESIPENETIYTGIIIDNLQKLLEKSYANPKDTMRAFHPKIVGLVKSEFIIETNLPENLRVGLFETPKTYPAWIRISNAKRKPQEDKKKDLRGMAIKVMEVEGEKLLESEKNAKTHDFLLITHPILQTDTVKSFQKGISALLGGILKMIPYALNPWNWRTLYLSIKSLKKFGNLLEAQFWSTTPYRFGSDSQAVKYSVIPQSNKKSSLPKNPSYDFLRERMEKDLSQNSVSFDFMVQFQTDAKKMPIEDPTKKWKSPFVKLATIRILKQSFNTEEQRDFGQNLAFTPWHCLPEHRPIGGANRARKDAYIALQEFRFDRTGKVNREPDGWEI
ncbi:MAG: hypothetical protein ACJAWV_000914 [Flammeovirgaceae bacterium]|jgi:hypothetical protein